MGTRRPGRATIGRDDDGRRSESRPSLFSAPCPRTSTVPAGGPRRRGAAPPLRFAGLARRALGPSAGHGDARATGRGWLATRPIATDREFVRRGACSWGAADGDDAPLGAWLLSTRPGTSPGAEPTLIDALRQPDARAAFEAARALGRIGGLACLPALRTATIASATPEARAAAAWAADAVAARQSRASADRSADMSLPPTFRRGVSWWFEVARRDGEARRLLSSRPSASAGSRSTPGSRPESARRSRLRAGRTSISDLETCRAS